MGWSGAFGVHDHLSWRVLGESDLLALQSLREHVLGTMPIKSFYLVEDADFLRDHLHNSGCIFGVHAGPRLVAYAAVKLPSSGRENLGHSLMRIDDLLSVANFASAMVLSEYRGFKLHRLLIRLREEFAISHGRTTLVARADPRNHFSWGNFLEEGFAIQNYVTVRNDHPRFVLCKDLRRAPQVSAEDEVMVDPLDPDAIRSLLSLGYAGTRVVRRDGRVCVFWSKLPASGPER